ncbi:MAG: hypothetical protein PHX82_04960 [Paracoccaceae bacterium]|nr:hypothetical protein [Paracoccaceae bacterium]
MSKHLAPIEVVEALIGPPETVGPIVGLNDKATYLWRRGSGSRDAGDIPAARYMRRLLAHASSKSLGLTAEHLIWGAPAAEIEQILAARGADRPPVAAE